VLRRLVQKLPFYTTAQQLADSNTAEFVRVFNDIPDADQTTVIETRAASVAVRRHAWEDWEHLKLIHIQQQDYVCPPASAYLHDDVGRFVGQCSVTRSLAITILALTATYNAG
jgi:hypothetical protein